MWQIRYKELVENISDWLWEVDANGVYTYCSDNVYDFLGVHADEVVGKTPFDFMSKEEAERVGKIFASIVSKKENIIRLENAILHKDGYEVVVETNGIPILDQNNNLIGYQGIDKDITIEKKLEKQLQLKNNALNELYDLVLKSTFSGTLILDVETNKIIYCNENAIQMFQCDSAEDILNKHPSELSPLFQPDRRRSDEKAEEMIETAIRNGTHTFEWVHLTKTKHETSIEVTLTAAVQDGKKVLYVVMKDISGRKEAEEKLYNQYNLIHNIIDAVPVRVFWKDKAGTYLGANKLFLNDAKLAQESDIIGKNDFEMPWADTEAKAYRDDDLFIMNSGRARLNFEESQTNKEGKTIYLSTSKIPLKDHDGNIIGILGCYEDITKYREAQKDLIKQKDILFHQAHHDKLTELPNRILFGDRLEQGIEKSKRTNKILALFFIDLDHFKEINDSLGHAVGDEVLKCVANRLKDTLRSEDTVARLGGDEFAIIMNDLHDASEASILAKKILQVFEEPMNIGNNVLYISTSIGISLYPSDGKEASTLLQYADSAMYRAKDEGRNNFQYYSAEMTELSFERLAMETSMREALKNKEFRVYYQEQVNGATNEMVGMEALIRWQHPTMGLVLPSKFMPLAESTGFIVEIDRYVMKIAIKQIAKWHHEGLDPGIIAMNLSVKQLKQKDFLTMLQEIIEESGCETDYLELEVTESQIMTNPEEGIEILKQISKMGIKIAIDDFGTGYSSLSYLKKLPIDKLKIDQSFVENLPDDEEDKAITRAIIALAKSLNLSIIAEGVETKEQRDFLVENGCQDIQGYFYGRPVSAYDMHQVLLRRSREKKS